MRCGSVHNYLLKRRRKEGETWDHGQEKLQCSWNNGTRARGRLDKKAEADIWASLMHWTFQEWHNSVREVVWSRNWSGKVPARGPYLRSLFDFVQSYLPASAHGEHNLSFQARTNVEIVTALFNIWCQTQWSIGQALTTWKQMKRCSCASFCKW